MSHREPIRAAEDVLVVMAKRPQRGRVKTRLAREIGEDATLDLYGAFLLDLSDRFGCGPWSLVWAVDPPGADLAGFVAGRGSIADQQGSGLAARMRNCFAALFRKGARRVVMIGSDVPHLRRESVETAFHCLTNRDAAFVPTRDGGYCLVALRRPHDLFSSVSMSTSRAFAETLGRARKLHLDVEVLDPSFDVDQAEDLRELERLLRAEPERAPRTRAVMLRIEPQQSPGRD